MAEDKTRPPVSATGPRIPERLMDTPSQRRYALGLGVMCQALKVFDFLQYQVSSDASGLKYFQKWFFADAVYILTLHYLRIPRLNYALAIVLLQIVSLTLLNGMLFGTVSLNLGFFGSTTDASEALQNTKNGKASLASTPEVSRLTGIMYPLALIGLGSSGSDWDHSNLQGEHTIRMSPISTAQLNPHHHLFCFTPNQSTLMIPIILNNTASPQVRISITPLGKSLEDSQSYTYNTKELLSFEKQRQDHLQVTRPSANSANPPSSSKQKHYEYDDDDEEEDAPSLGTLPSNLQSTQSMIHVPISRPGGTIRLEHVHGNPNAAARILFPSEVVIAPCPTAAFKAETESDKQARCAGRDKDLQLDIGIVGVPPLSLRWYKEINGHKEHFLVEGVESAQRKEDSLAIEKRVTRGVESVHVPLTASLDHRGTYHYVLEEVIDAIGNSVPVNQQHSSSSKSVLVLRRPTVSFRSCRPGSAASILAGGDTQLTVTASEADDQDGPWDVDVEFQPEQDDVQPTSFTIKTKDGRREANIKATAPGRYIITGVRGKYCEGDVLEPDTCQVVEKSQPTAQIEWKRIHECSGDTGVSASLILHGQPPFQVLYRTQRNNEPAKDLIKTFATSIGEITLQPERSGKYVYKFIQLSDANYKKLPLDGPTIEQVVYPLAAAEFSNSGSKDRSRKSVNSCSGSTVEVDIDLSGSGPWNVELQVIGPRGSEIMKIDNVTSNRKTVTVPIPQSVDKQGGSFDVDLVSIEDANKCKRSLSVPGISVKVRRVKPIAKFYGKSGSRHVSVLEDDVARLPLRMTGDGPWEIKYRNQDDPDRIRKARINSPNDVLEVHNKGIYEIVEVSDSQCTGTVDTAASTYAIEWLPRPSASLASGTEAAHIAHNRSYVLPPICEGIKNHVDLDLTGRAPFQILYNIAQDDGYGGSNVIETPIFNSIQPRTRFELHTSPAGRKYYEVKQIGDAVYPLANQRAAPIPVSRRLLFEQNVLSRPLAAFKTRQRLSYCLNDMFKSKDSSSIEGVIQLQGTPPFELTISLKDYATSRVTTETIKLNSKTWAVNIASYQFTSIGPHMVNIESIRDAAGCDQGDIDPVARSLWIDVAETAAIIPFDRVSHYCVGDVSRFQLEGTPPWTIGYSINGKKHKQVAHTSPFSLVQQQAGEFGVISIVAEKQKMCKAAVMDLKFDVRPVPSAKVASGRNIYQDIHEGDQAEIIFSLTGEPPFTFTYQRAEPPSRQGGPPGKILETHTVTNIHVKEYSIYSALEGTWTVTSISDKYCRYPPAQNND